MKTTLTITGIGSQGHGVATLNGKTVHVPYTLTGDVVEVTTQRGRNGLEVKLKRIVTPAPNRQQPPCPYFGQCGGCTLQHLLPADYTDFKYRQVTDTLAKRGLTDCEVTPVVGTPPHSRQRLRLALRQTAGGLVMGFQAFKSHHIVGIQSCAVAHPALQAAFEPLREGLTPLLPQGIGLDAQLTLTETGLDILLDGEWQLDLSTREGLAELAERLDVARLIVRTKGFDDPVAIRRAPVVTLGGRAVTLPPGAFLQASRGSADILTNLVARAIPTGTRKVADLFSGLGTFSLPLAAAGHSVHAVEGAAPPLMAQQSAAHGLPLTTEVRDLFEMPLMAAELSAYGAVVLDPPRAGAQAQVLQLGQSTVPLVVYVSCSPSTFARDARLLVDAGYRLRHVTPVDQFVWSPHTELVSVFER
jgi:23S rRNA (uracil1939-C5)-methyltransferase